MRTSAAAIRSGPLPTTAQYRRDGAADAAIRPISSRWASTCSIAAGSSRKARNARSMSAATAGRSPTPAAATCAKPPASSHPAATWA